MSQRALSAGFWTPDRTLEVELPMKLNRPDVGSTFGSKTTEHEVIDGTDTSGEQNVVQHMGMSILEYDVSGACWPSDAETLERMAGFPQIKVRLPDRGTRDVMISDGDTSATRTYFEDAQGGDGAYLKEFSLTLIQLGGGR